MGALAEYAGEDSGLEGKRTMALAHAIMTALLEDDLSGYELARDFETSLGFFWQASHQQIYLELRKLSDKHWLSKREVSQRGKPNKIVYGLTKAGREALAEWVYSTTRTQAAKDDLLVKLYNLDSGNAGHLRMCCRWRGSPGRTWCCSMSCCAILRRSTWPC